MNEKTFFRVVFFFSVVMFASGVAIGFVSSNGYKTRAVELEGTVRELADALAESESRASRIAEQLEIAQGELAIIRGRISVAQTIASEIDAGISEAIGTIDRIIRKVELLESALSVVLDW